MVALVLVVRVGNDKGWSVIVIRFRLHTFLPAGDRCTLGLSTDCVWGHV